MGACGVCLDSEWQEQFHFPLQKALFWRTNIELERAQLGFPAQISIHKHYLGNMGNEKTLLLRLLAETLILRKFN